VETNAHDLSNLFHQLGLSGAAGDVDAFIATHRSKLGSNLWEADFWSAAQARFLKSAIADDADWASTVDDLAVRLS
jgi:hypothetical protein